MRPSTAFQKVLLIILLAFGSISQAGVVSAGTNIWTSIGPEGGTIQALAINPATPNTLYAGAYDGTGKYDGAYSKAKTGAGPGYR